MNDSVESALLDQIESCPIRDSSAVILDVDEVTLHHRRHLIDFLAKQGIEIFEPQSEQEVSLRYHSSGAAVHNRDRDRLLEDAFVDFASIQEPFEGAVDSVERLSSRCSVLFLTNVPSNAFVARSARLRYLGFNIPIYRNVGGKGRAVSILQRKSRSKVIFVDDSQRQIRNVKMHAPSVFTIQARFTEGLVCESSESSHAEVISRNWSELEALILSKIET